MKIVKPSRVKRDYVQTLIGTPEAVFPLLCPVREAEWVNGWDPDLVISQSGLAELGCIFTIGPSDVKSIWIVTTYDPLNFKISFLKVTPAETVAVIDIELERSSGGTLAHISYQYTAISAKGVTFVENFTEEYYDSFMKEWENECNHYLITGKKLIPNL
ncbi:hypothetical protein F9K33_12575 [bacterium]|nr:MAG: hypothetical protein F9K33_12575 [bacterium]